MKQITCVTCPIGCCVSIEDVDGQIRFSGNRCKKGKEFASKELLSPVRSITTTVRTAFYRIPVLPVRTNGEVPKDRVTEIIRELSNIVITEKIGIGEVVAADILGTGCDVIATSDILKRSL